MLIQRCPLTRMMNKLRDMKVSVTKLSWVGLLTKKITCGAVTLEKKKNLLKKIMYLHLIFRMSWKKFRVIISKLSKGTILINKIN